ncbi:MAG: cytochrome, partial [Marmoricola sp.]|nr:cytochrome [Marmoricola sp.]
MTVTTTGVEGIREVSRRFPDSEHGHLEDLRDDPIDLLHRVREECGDIGRFRLADRDVVLVTGAVTNEAFFRAPDDILD